MMKRYQVLIPEWMEDYLKIAVERYDFTFSEVIRAMISISMLSIATTLQPEYKPGFDIDEILNELTKYPDMSLENEEMHDLLSKLYFETRKAVEYREAKLKEQKKKN
jgi:DNA-directed RNA polymerase delta subunit